MYRYNLRVFREEISEGFTKMVYLTVYTCLYYMLTMSIFFFFLNSIRSRLLVLYRTKNINFNTSQYTCFRYSL